jgi:hypothetical protein
MGIPRMVRVWQRLIHTTVLAVCCCDAKGLNKFKCQSRNLVLLERLMSNHKRNSENHNHAKQPATTGIVTKNKGRVSPFFVSTAAPLPFRFNIDNESASVLQQSNDNISRTACVFYERRGLPSPPHQKKANTRDTPQSKNLVYNF